MRQKFFGGEYGWFVMISVILLLAMPITGYAQEASVSGTVTDTTGGVLPGVTVTAVNEASGNSFTAVTDGRGGFRIPARVGAYRLVVELQGFATLTRSGLELLVGQQAVVNLQMVPGGVQETVTVTGESPLIDVTQSRVGGNIDPRQMQELPVNGRNWLDLTMLAPGSRATSVGEGLLPSQGGSRSGNARGAYQINVDGQQVTTIIGPTSIGQPAFSRDAIAEFEFVANRFDASQGRSSGVQVNAVTKSGTNTPAGTASGYFRDDSFNAADFIQRRVLPYSNRQLSFTFGGPIRKDKIHIFGHYEYEREPRTQTFSSPFPRFNIDLSSTRREYKGGVRLDVQFSPRTRLTVRGSKWDDWEPRTGAGGATIHPSSVGRRERDSDQLFVTLGQILGNRAVNEVKAGYAGFQWIPGNNIENWPNSPCRDIYWVHGGDGSPSISLLGYSIGTGCGQNDGQAPYSIRDDFSYSFLKGGRHDLKVGGEYIYNQIWVHWCNNCTGQIDARGGRIPANIEDLFPVWNDASTWNLAALSPITVRYRQNFGTFQQNVLRHVSAGWLQDDWAITPRLTVNLGVRYDLVKGALAENVTLLPFLSGDRPSDTNNIAPRFGAALSLNDRTVIRGGFGKYFGELVNITSHWNLAWSHQAQIDVLNDGRPDFAANPFNGPPPTYEQIVQRLCDTAPGPSCQRRDITGFLASPGMQIPYNYQTSIGIQRQLGDKTMAVEADYVYSGGRHEFLSQNINLSYDPATRVNYPFTDISKRPYPDWGVIVMERTEGRSSYHALLTTFTKRFSQGWQATGTYTLSGLWDGIPQPLSGLSPVRFPLAEDIGAQYGLAQNDQRHRAVVNGIWDLGYGFQVSGLYFFGSGERLSTNYGGDLRNTGGASIPGGGQGASESRLRPDGTIVPRNTFIAKPIHRVDVRGQRRFRVGGRARVDGILEVFNLFNHANYGSYVLQESARNYGQPSANLNIAYQPRILQLGFRFAF